ncbi:MAG: CoA transferase, partial [Firmicutes bacterium]|nr:CoA transferase [Bacillota bacterium]
MFTQLLHPGFKGYRLLDLTRLLPGPYASFLLSNLGIEVIKIEEP